MARFRYALTRKQLTGIGKEEGLKGARLKLYLGFMRGRLPNEGAPSYAGEWARRFMRGTQYTYGDLKSRAVLNKVAKKMNYPTRLVRIRSGGVEWDWQPNWDALEKGKAKIPYVEGGWKHFR
jgi:hypothetical protein